MGTCKNCGAACAPEARFCYSCGARLVADQQRKHTDRADDGHRTDASEPHGGTPTDVPDDFEAAYARYSRYRDDAARGDAEANYQMGLIYMQGIGTTQDKKKAVACFKLAAQKGHRQAAIELGRYWCVNFCQLAEAARLLMPVAQEGNAQAQFLLGHAYMRACYLDNMPAMSVDRTYSSNNHHMDVAITWLKLAAKNGSQEACQELANIFMYGKAGVEVDMMEAILWLRHAAEAGDDWSMSTLYNIYSLGIGGIPVNRELANKFLDMRKRK